MAASHKLCTGALFCWSPTTQLFQGGSNKNVLLLGTVLASSNCYCRTATGQQCDLHMATCGLSLYACATAHSGIPYAFRFANIKDHLLHMIRQELWRV